VPPTEHPPAAIGSRLRDARQRRALTLRTIADKTKISKSALEALERNDISKLPGGIFSRAFVRSYAIEVGLDPEETVRDFIVQFPNDSVTAGHPTASPVEDNEAIESSRTIARAILWLLLLSVPLMGAVMYFGMAGRPKPPAPPELSSAPASVQEPGAEPLTAVPRLSDAVDPSREATPASTTGHSSVAPVPASSSPSGKPEGTAGALASTPGQDRLSIAVVATGRTRIALTVDGVAAPERQLLGGERQVIEARRDFVVWVEDAGALRLTINGAQARALGDPGEPAMVRLDLTNFRRYLTTQ
jgi:cytoskeletal protein RodZ